MKLSLQFFMARRYLFARKSHNVINVITLVSMIAIMVGTMAMVIVLSVFNGIEKLVVSMFNAFHADLEISLYEGRRFSMNDFPENALEDIPGLVHYSQVLDESALLIRRDRQQLVQMRGVDEIYRYVTGIDTLMFEGEFLLHDEQQPLFVLGRGAALALGVHILDYNELLHLYVPRRGRVSLINPRDAFSVWSSAASGVFDIRSEYDSEFVVVPIELARELLDSPDEVSSIVIRLAPGASAGAIQRQLSERLGPEYRVRTRIQQQDFLYRILRSEKWVIFFILCFILIIAAFNMVGSLSMLVIEKQRDISTLHSLGAPLSGIRRVFLLEGFLVSAGGALAGLLLGLFVCWLQIRFGLVGLYAEGNYVMQAYPVAVKFSDLLLIGITVLGIGGLSSLLPVRYIGRRLPASFQAD